MYLFCCCHFICLFVGWFDSGSSFSTSLFIPALYVGAKLNTSNRMLKMHKPVRSTVDFPIQMVYTLNFALTFLAPRKAFCYLLLALHSKKLHTSGVNFQTIFVHFMLWMGSPVKCKFKNSTIQMTFGSNAGDTRFWFIAFELNTWIDNDQKEEKKKHWIFVVRLNLFLHKYVKKSCVWERKREKSSLSETATDWYMECE